MRACVSESLCVYACVCVDVCVCVCGGVYAFLVFPQPWCMVVYVFVCVVPHLYPVFYFCRWQRGDQDQGEVPQCCQHRYKPLGLESYRQPVVGHASRLWRR